MDRAQLLDMFRTKASEVAEKDLSWLDESSVIASLGLDSLSTLEIIGAMEQSLDIKIPDDRLVGVEKVSNLIDVVEKSLKG
jgi:acyl carrier protein